MKLILNSTTLEITAKVKENRHKIEANGTFVTSGGQWALSQYYTNCTAYFIDLKAGDALVIKPKTSARIYIALTTNESPVDEQAVSFANGTTGRIRQNSEYSANIASDCYLWVLCYYQEGSSGTPEDFTPASIEINGLLLDENGYL